MAKKRARKPSSAKRSSGGGRRSSPGSAAVDTAQSAPAAAASATEPDPAEDEKAEDDNGLTIPMNRFVGELLADPDLNAARAAGKAYPNAKPTTLRSMGSELLQNPKVRAEIKRRLAPAVIKARMSRDRVLAAIGDGLNWDPADAYNADGSFKAIRDMPPEVRKQIAGIDIEETVLGTTVVGRTKKVRFLSRTDHLQMAARVHKLLVERVEVQDASGRADRIRRARERSGK